MFYYLGVHKCLLDYRGLESRTLRTINPIWYLFCFGDMGIDKVE